MEVKTIEQVLNEYNVTLLEVNNICRHTTTKQIMADLLQGDKSSFDNASNAYKAAVIIRLGRKE